MIESDKTLALYIHIPFCRSKCHYCDFVSFAGLSESLIQSYFQAMQNELLYYVNSLSSKPEVATIYIGGGTPSSVHPDLFSSLFQIVKHECILQENIEWTFEVNPDSLTDSLCRFLKDSGVNRISMGVQSFNDRFLKLLGRPHSEKDVFRAIELVQSHQFTDWSLDLMCGLPQQSLDNFHGEIEKLLDLKPPHISLYPLTIEENTLFEQMLERGDISPQNDDLVADMLIRGEEILHHHHHYNHYEIASYSKKGHESRHNCAYWLRKPYLGIGLAAASFRRTIRRQNTADLNTYISFWLEQPRCRKKVSLRDVPGSYENISEAEACFESILLGTRLLEGFDLELWRKQFDIPLTGPFERTITSHLNKGTIELSNNRFLHFSAQGRWIANTFWSDLYSDFEDNVTGKV